MPTKLEKQLKQIFMEKIKNELDEVTLMKFLADIDDGLSFNDAVKKHVDKLSQETKDLLYDVEKQIIREREQKSLLEQIREDIRWEKIEETQRLESDKEEAKRKQEHYEVNRKNLINGHNQVAEALWNQKLKSVENPQGKGQAFSLSPKIEGQLIWKYLMWKPKQFFHGIFNEAYVEHKVGFDEYPIIDDNPRKTAKMISKGMVKKTKRIVTDKKKFTFGELLTQLRHSESLSFVQEGKYKRRDLLGDSIHIEFETDVKWLSIEVKHPSRLANGIEVVQDNGKFLIKFTVTANHSFFEDLKSNKKGGKITVNGVGYRLATS